MDRIESLHKVTPEPVSNKALTDFPPIFMLRAVRHDISLWGMSLPTTISPCCLPTSSYILDIGAPEDSRGNQDNIRVGTHHKLPCCFRETWETPG